jgi:hypothetical protein
MFEVDSKSIGRRNAFFSYWRFCERFVSFFEIWLIGRFFIVALEEFRSRVGPWDRRHLQIQTLNVQILEKKEYSGR